jgi:hypothetical protein
MSTEAQNADKKINPREEVVYVFEIYDNINNLK